MYWLVVRGVQRSLQQTAWTHCALQTCRRTLGISTLQGHAILTPWRVKHTDELTYTRADGHCSLAGAVICAQKRYINLDTSLRSPGKEERERGEVSTWRRGGAPRPSAAQKVKEAGRDFTYLIVVLIGLGVTGGLLYVVFQELFSSSSPSSIYGKAFNKTKSNPEVIGAFGEPIKCYGETTRRGRRQQVSHTEFLKDGVKHMRLKFYIEGAEPGLKGTVHSESRQNPDTGKYEFRYIVVEMENAWPRRTIVVEDNRQDNYR